MTIMAFESRRVLRRVILAGFIFAVLVIGPSGSVASAADAGVHVVDLGDRFRVTIGGELFTEYRTQGFRVPIFYPLNGPRGVEITRHYPMRDDVPGEAKDHPHQRSMWYSHGRVNDVDFWADHDQSGRIVHVRTLSCEAVDGVAVVQTLNRWERPDGAVICYDTRCVRFGADNKSRYIDFQISIAADHGDVVMGDTKEGTMAIRTHPALNLSGERASGHAINSQGDADVAVWGKRAKWVDYWASIDDRPIGIAIFDHPLNPRHPTWWHAREYGLIAANPFGVHDFEQKPEHSGDMRIPFGESAEFRYLFLFHEGDVKQADVSGRYDAWSRSGKP